MLPSTARSQRSRRGSSRSRSRSSEFRSCASAGLSGARGSLHMLRSTRPNCVLPSWSHLRFLDVLRNVKAFFEFDTVFGFEPVQKIFRYIYIGVFDRFGYLRHEPLVDHVRKIFISLGSPDQVRIETQVLVERHHLFFTFLLNHPRLRLDLSASAKCHI